MSPPRVAETPLSQRVLREHVASIYFNLSATFLARVVFVLVLGGFMYLQLGDPMVLPFVVLGDVAGLEIVHAAAVVVLGGLVTTTLLALVCIPALYLRFGARSAQDTLGLATEPA